MDKPRHPQVILPWKNQGIQKARFQAPAKDDPRHGHGGKLMKEKGNWKVEKEK
jgi:hypothetical protein